MVSGRCKTSLNGSLRQRMHDDRPGYRCDWPGKQRREVLIDPLKRASVGLLGACVIVEDADRCHGVVWRVDHVVRLESGNIADDWNGALFDPARQLLGHAGLRLGLTDGGVHGTLPQWTIRPKRNTVLDD